MSSTQRQIGDVLSELARDNYRGLIDPHTYRLQRAQLLDQLVEDEDEEASTTTRPQGKSRDRRAANPPLTDPTNQRRRDVDRVREQIETEEVLQIVEAARRQAREAVEAASAAAEEAPAATETATRPRRGPAAPADPPPARADTAPRAPRAGGALPSAEPGRSKLPLVAGVVAAVVVVGIVVVMLSGGEDTAPPPADSRSATLATAPGERLLADFMQAGNWSAGELLALTAQWERLLPSQRQQTLDSAAYRSFSYEVRRRLLEAAALRELEGGGTDGGNALTALALAMNLPVPLADETAAEAVDNIQPAQATPEPAPAPPDSSNENVSPEPPEASMAVDVDSAPTAGPAVEPVPAARSVTATPPAADAQVAAAAVETVTKDEAAVPDEAPGVVAPTDSGCHAGLLRTRQRSCADALVVGAEGPRIAIIKPGSFTMGSKWAPEEGPAHSVTLASAFGMGAHEVSHDEYQRYCTAAGVRCPDNPWSAGDYPVVDVSWDEAVAYTRWLSAQTGRRYRLPTEAEWEFAARAGVESRYPFGDELLPVQARYASGLGAAEPWPRSYRDAPRNRFGMYNSIGNVREWVADAWNNTHGGAPADGSARSGAGDSARVVRGGSYADESTALRLSSRARQEQAARDSKTGFRVALDF